MNDDELIKKRFCELSMRAGSTGRPAFTGFLTLAEQAVLISLRLGGAPFELFGGVEGTQRQVARFSDDGSADWPITCLAVEQRGKKFPCDLSHRDYLGAILSLGIERSTVGDIVLRGNGAYVFALDSVAPFIAENLSEVKRASVDVRIADAKELASGPMYGLRAETVQIASERLDAVVARAYSLSREESLALFREKRVFIAGALCENNSRRIEYGDLISVRGHGRFIYRGIVRISKKGKLNAVIERYV